MVKADHVAFLVVRFRGIYSLSIRCGIFVLWECSRLSMKEEGDMAASRDDAVLQMMCFLISRGWKKRLKSMMAPLCCLRINLLRIICYSSLQPPTSTVLLEKTFKNTSFQKPGCALSAHAQYDPHVSRELVGAGLSTLLLLMPALRLTLAWVWSAHFPLLNGQYVRCMSPQNIQLSLRDQSIKCIEMEENLAGRFGHLVLAVVFMALGGYEDHV